MDSTASSDSPKSHSVTGPLALVGAAAVYGSFGLLIREMAEMYSDSAQVAARFLLAALLCCFPFWVLKKSDKKIGKVNSKAKLYAFLLGLVFSSSVLCFTIAANDTKIANVVFLLYASSIVASVLIGTILFRESLTRNKLIAVGLSAVGIAVFCDVGLISGLALIMGIFCGITDAVANSFRKMISGAPRYGVLRIQYLTGGLVMLIPMILSGDDPITDVAVLPIVITVVFALANLFMSSLLLYGFKHIDMNVGSVILATEAVFAAVLAYLFLGESLTGQEIVGGLLILAAAVTISIPAKEPKKADDAETKDSVEIDRALVD